MASRSRRGLLPLWYAASPRLLAWIAAPLTYANTSGSSLMSMAAFASKGTQDKVDKQLSPSKVKS